MTKITIATLMLGMVPINETFSNTFPFTPHTFNGNGFIQHYVDEGPRTAEVVVCLHGQPTWSYLYRDIIKSLSKKYRVVVPDHMGFGKSETPQHLPYTLKQHTENFVRLITHLGLKNITLISQDWGGLIATQFAVRHVDKIKRLIYANTVTGYGKVDDSSIPAASESQWFKWFASGIENGRSEQVLRNAGSTILSVMKIIGLERKNIDDEWVRAYSSPFPTWESAIGVWEFPLDAHSGRSIPYLEEGFAGVEAIQCKPALLLEGLEDKAIPPARAIATFRSLWPNAPVIELPGVGHFCQEDAPEILISNILQFIQTNP